jgi:phospholipase A1
VRDPHRSEGLTPVRDTGTQRARRRRFRAGATALALASLACSIAAQEEPVQRCVNEPDDARRLACYDQLFRRTEKPATEAPPAPEAAASAPAAPAPAATAFDTFWELSPEHKRGTFSVRTHLPNFVLPFHYTSSLNPAPSSPTRAAVPQSPNNKPVDVKLQISLRAKMIEGLLLPNADLWFAYTGRSLWQLWNQKDSSPFRSTDYQPEAIYVVPVPDPVGTLPAGWRWRMVQLGLVHQSNGQTEPLSRSWNRVYLTGGFNRGEFGLTMRAEHRLGDSNDDNPDISRYVGNGEVVAAWLPGLATALLTWRFDARNLSRGSLQFDWTYPVSRSQPAGLRWYVQLFSGYGETLLDYNHHQTSFGLGLSLFQF